jgi:hypothetical protein
MGVLRNGKRVKARYGCIDTNPPLCPLPYIYREGIEGWVIKKKG